MTLFVTMVLLVAAAGAWAQTPSPVVPEAGKWFQWLLLGSCLVGAFLFRWADDKTPTFTRATLWYVLSGGGAAYLVATSGVIPDSLLSFGEDNPVRAAITCLLVGGFGGAGLTLGFQALVDSVVAKFVNGGAKKP